MNQNAYFYRDHTVNAITVSVNMDNCTAQDMDMVVEVMVRYLPIS